MLRTSIFVSFAVFTVGCPLRPALQVGPGKPFATPCNAIAAAMPGDLIEIDPVLYSGDVCGIYTDNLTLRGVNGRAHVDAAGKNFQGKATWVIASNNVTVENVEFSGSAVPDNNGAGIRAAGTNLTVRNCYFHDNQDGILGGAGTVLIEGSEFNHNGYTDGQAHNLYISHADVLIFRYNYTHNATVGHLFKSRVAVNYLLYNRFSDEQGSASYEIDLPNGGTSYVIGNLIEQGPNSENDSVLAYLEEGVNSLNPGMDLYVVNNTFVNRMASGRFVATGVADTIPVVIKNNIFFGAGGIANHPGADLANNLTRDPLFVNASVFDYRLRAGSPAIDAGADPDRATGGFPLAPSVEYLHPACGEARITIGAIDIGAYEFGGAGAKLPCR